MLEELKTFMTVVEVNHFTKAAERLHLSQPSVSIQIRRLEEHFGTTLIKRSNKEKNIYITDTGKFLYESAKEMVQLLEDTQNTIHQMEDVVAGKLRIGASLTVGECILSQYLKLMSSHYPDVHFDIFIGNTEEICQKVQNLEIDIGLVEGNIPPKDFSYEAFFKDEMVLVKQNDGGEEKPVFDKKQLQNKIWISREDGSGTSEELHKFLYAYKIKPKDTITMGSNYAVKEAVVHGLGLTLISNELVKRDIEEGKLTKISLPEPIIRYMCYMVTKDVKMHAIKEKFIQTLLVHKNF